jgi:hypothetical protein
MEKKKNIMIRESPLSINKEILNTREKYYYFQVNDYFRDDIIKITLIISIISLAVGCFALAIALMK